MSFVCGSVDVNDVSSSKVEDYQLFGYIFVLFTHSRFEVIKVQSASITHCFKVLVYIGIIL